MKKHSVLVGVVLMVMLLLSACGANEETSADGTSSPTLYEKQNLPLEVPVVGYDDHNDYMKVGTITINSISVSKEDCNDFVEDCKNSNQDDYDYMKYKFKIHIEGKINGKINPKNYDGYKYGVSIRSSNSDSEISAKFEKEIKKDGSFVVDDEAYGYDDFREYFVSVALYLDQHAWYAI